MSIVRGRPDLDPFDMASFNPFDLDMPSIVRRQPFDQQDAMWHLPLFLSRARSQWPRITEEDLRECSEQQKETIRGMESLGANGQYAILCDMVLNCHNEYRFAKMYVAMKDNANKAYAHKAIKNAPPELSAAMRKICMMQSETLRKYLREWFFHRWSCKLGSAPTEAIIEKYANTGCLGLVLILPLLGLTAAMCSLL